MRRRMVTAIAMAMTFGLAGTLVSACSGPGPKHVIVYDVLEADLVGAQPNLPVEQIEYTYQTGGSQGPDGGDTLSEGTPLPWHQSVTVHGKLSQLVLSVDLKVPTGADESLVPTVQCQIRVDGTLVLSKTGQGAIDCEADQDTITAKLG